MGVFSRRHFLHAGCTIAAITLVPNFLDRAQAGLNFHGSPPLGPVSTRASIPGKSDSTNKQFNSRSWHIARTAISQLTIACPNWFCDGSNEVGSGGTATVFAAIEYPAATFTRVTWNSGATSVSISNSTTAFSDAISISIPNGATYYIRFFFTGAVASVRSRGLNIDLTRGDALNTAASGLSDQTMSGTITDSGTGDGFYPAALLAQMGGPSVAIIGDSIALGTQDTPDASGDQGIVARGIGGSFGYVNLGVGNDSAVSFLSSHALRVALAQYASTIVIQYGVNDLVASRTSAQILADRSSIAALLPGKNIIETTITPRTTSTDSWATTGNQTVANSGQETNRVAANTSIRAGRSGFSHFAETTNVVETAQNSGIWQAPGFTLDGVHLKQADYITASASINTSWIV